MKMEKIKCFICLEENNEKDMVKICKCNESYLCLQPCYQAFILEHNYYFLESQKIKCPICKNQRKSYHHLHCDWKRSFFVIELYFLVLYYPFICLIMPIIYIFVLQSSENENNIFVSEKTENVATGFFSQLGLIIFSVLFYIYVREHTKYQILKKKRNYVRAMCLCYTLTNIIMIILDSYVVFLRNRYIRIFLIVNCLTIIFISGVILYNLYLCLIYLIVFLIKEIPICIRKVGISCGCLIIRPVYPEDEKIDF